MPSENPTSARAPRVRGARPRAAARWVGLEGESKRVCEGLTGRLIQIKCKRPPQAEACGGRLTTVTFSTLTRSRPWLPCNSARSAYGRG
jgi:hypothetical protein